VGKTVCMVFPPRNRDMQMASNFPLLNIVGLLVQFVLKFKYLGHIINTKLTDDDDIQREICNIFIRTFIRIFLHVNLGIVHLMLRYYCLKVIVFAFLTL